MQSLDVVVTMAGGIRTGIGRMMSFDQAWYKTKPSCFKLFVCSPLCNYLIWPVCFSHDIILLSIWTLIAWYITQTFQNTTVYFCPLTVWIQFNSHTLLLLTLLCPFSDTIPCLLWSGSANSPKYKQSQQGVARVNMNRRLFKMPPQSCRATECVSLYLLI